MTEQQERYDRVAGGYARWWAPVIAPTAVRVLDRVAPLVEAGARRILDLGTGTGTLSVAAIRRWPRVEIVGIDASGEMAAAARRQADAVLGPADRARYEVRTAFADELPFAEGEFDAAVSSFVLQLVPSRLAALREVRRVLRPGGRMAHVTWIVGRDDFQPDRVLDRVLEEFGVGPRDADGPRGDYESVEAAAAGLRRAGYRNVVAEAAELAHQFDVEGYAGFIEEFDEESTWDEFEPRERAQVSARLRAALRRLDPDALVLRSPVVIAHGDRPER